MKSSNCGEEKMPSMRVKDIFRKQGGMRLIRQYMKSGALLTAILQFFILGKNRTGLEILRLATQLKTKRKLERRYRKKLLEIESNYDSTLPHNNCKKIWVCWLQGIDNAPEIVKVCYKSLRKNIACREIILITEENYRKYIEFPAFIQAKIDKGIIKGAHMTDLLRLELLTKYGGTWIDATVLCTSENIPPYMLEADLFMFQCLKPGRDGHTTVISNWFITAASNNRLLFNTRELLYSYWSKNNSLIDYYIFHLFFQICIDLYPEDWINVIPFCNSVPHILLLRLFEKYDEEVWKSVCNITPFHKLTYKFERDEMKPEDSYYKKIMEVYG